MLSNHQVVLFLLGSYIVARNFPEQEISQTKQLNTITDLIINFSESVKDHDKVQERILRKINSSLEQHNPGVDYTEKLQEILFEIKDLRKENNIIFQQLDTLRDRVEKTLYKADKFPSKKDIRELLELPNEIERRTLEQIENFQHNQTIKINNIKEKNR